MRSLDLGTAERLLDGQIEPDDAPPGYGVVARVIAVLRASEKTERHHRAPVVTVTTRSRVRRRRHVDR